MEYLSGIDNSWRDIILNYQNFSKLEEFILNEYNTKCVYPKKSEIFNTFKYFNLEDTKVVILGQDPYHTKDMAIGVCFGTKNKKIPPSLKNIEKELLNDIGKKIEDYSLQYLLNQGILLLNTSLTVIESKPGSHMKYWKSFTKYLIEYLNVNCDNLIFVAWGAFAHEILKDINTEKHTLIVSSHPSPLSNSKPYGIYPMFNNSKPFSKINNQLIKYGKKSIDW